MTTFPTPRLKHVVVFNTFLILIYEYEPTILPNKGTLTDYITSIEIGEQNYERKLFMDLLSCYKYSLKRLKFAKYFTNDFFFHDRVKSRLVDWYLNNPLFEYTFEVNRIIVKPQSILRQTQAFFEKHYRLLGCLTQGDPVGLNLGMKPVFFDFSTSGKNCLIGEIAIFYWGILSGEAYFYPKYHHQAYTAEHSKVYKLLDKNKPEISYRFDPHEKNVQVNIKYSPHSVRNEIINEYLDFFCQDSRVISELNKYIKYYLVMRIMTVLHVGKMDFDDQIISIAFAIIFFSCRDENYLDFMKDLAAGIS